MIDTATAETLADTVAIDTWRTADNGERFAVVKHLTAKPSPTAVEKAFSLEADSLRPWVLSAIFEREQSGHGAFLTELRPTVALFLRFLGIDYDGDAQAGEKLNRFVSQVQNEQPPAKPLSSLLLVNWLNEEFVEYFRWNSWTLVSDRDLDPLVSALSGEDHLTRLLICHRLDSVVYQNI